MKEQSIPFQNVSLYRPLIESYLRKEKKIKPLVNYFFDEDSISSFIKQRNEFPLNRELLFDVISEQYKRDDLQSPPILESIREKNTYTVTTGHQLSLLGGPLFFIYKIIAAINLAEKLNIDHSEFNFIPVFWMATEDHDFEEINKVSILEKEYEWKTNQGGAVGRFLVDESLIFELKKVADQIQGLPFGNDFSNIINKSYILGSSLASSTRRFVSLLIKDDNLIIVDGDDARFKNEFTDVVSEEINKQTTYKFVSETDKYLKNFGFHSQVHVRDINLFHLSENDRIRFNYETPTDLESEDISPNALLRPVYQEKILPNIAYIGGGGEMAYWLQLKSTFEAFNVNFPALVIRNSVIIISPKLQRNIAKLSLKIEDLFDSINDLKKRFVLETSEENLDLSIEINEFKNLYGSLKNKVFKVDPSLEGKVLAESKRVENNLKDLEKRLIRHQKSVFNRELKKVEQSKIEIFPKGTFQERSISVAEVYSHYGDNFKQLSKAKINVFDNSIKIIEL